MLQSKTEYISPEGLRLDGRRAGEIRRVTPSLGAVPGADGSALFQIGNTKVTCSVFGPHECRRRGQALHDRAIINVTYNIANFSRSERKPFNKNDRYQMYLCVCFCLRVRLCFLKDAIRAHILPIYIDFCSGK